MDEWFNPNNADVVEFRKLRDEFFELMKPIRSGSPQVGQPAVGPTKENTK